MPKGHLYDKLKNAMRQLEIYDHHFEADKKQLAERMCRGFRLTKEDMEKIFRELRRERSISRKNRKKVKIRI